MVTSANSGAAPTGGANAGPAPPKADDPRADVHVTPGVGFEGVTEEKIEYRDEDGNLLNDEQVASLEGKVSFQTRYETRTRLVDEFGREVADGIDVDVDGHPPEPMGEEAEGVAGTVIGGVEQETVGGPGEGEKSTVPGVVKGVGEDLKKERERGEGVTEAVPEEGVAGVTGKDEL